MKYLIATIAVAAAMLAGSWSDGSAPAADWSSSKAKPQAVQHLAPMQRTGWPCTPGSQSVPYSPGHLLICINLGSYGWEWWLTHSG